MFCVFSQRAWPSHSLNFTSHHFPPNVLLLLLPFHSTSLASSFCSYSFSFFKMHYVLALFTTPNIHLLLFLFLSLHFWFLSFDPFPFLSVYFASFFSILFLAPLYSLSSSFLFCYFSFSFHFSSISFLPFFLHFIPFLQSRPRPSFSYVPLPFSVLLTTLSL